MNALPFQLTELQWALLIFGLVVVLLVIVASLRRDKGGSSVKTDARGSRVIAQPRVEEPSTYGISGEFDEFGVGRPRRAGEPRPANKMPQLNIEPGPVRAAPPPERKMPSYMSAPTPSPTVTPVAAAARRIAPTIHPPAVTAPEPAPTERPPAQERQHVQAPQAQERPQAQPAPARKGEDKIVTLLVARNSGGAMAGPKIHAALSACGLSFGPMQIYHRKREGKRVFSVASLLKPGFLIPEDADGFSTMALSVFMVLPGPVEAQAAFEDLLKTAQRLAEQLDAQVYDDRRQPLSGETAEKLRGDIKAWAARVGA